MMAFFLSLAAGIAVAFFHSGFGVIVSISIIGAFIVYLLEEKK